MNPRIRACFAALLGVLVTLTLACSLAQAQNFRYEPKSRASGGMFSYGAPEAAPRLLPGSERQPVAPRSGRGYLYPRRDMAQRVRYDQQPTPARRPPEMHEVETVPSGSVVEPFSEDMHGHLPPTPPRESYENDDGYQGETFYEEGGMPGDEFYDEGYGPCVDCDECGASYCEIIRCLCQCMRKSYLYSPSMWRNFQGITGIQGFKGPADLGVNGNFGFNKSVNWATPFWNAHGIGHQLGATIAFSDFEGNSGPLGSKRVQYFVTTGLFRRPKCEQGFQGGAVFDYLHDDFYVNMNLMQMRAELSYLHGQHELGFWGAFHLNQDTSTVDSIAGLTQTTWLANNQYNLFYRYNYGHGLNYRMWIGLNDYADVLFGGDCTAQFADRWSLQTSTNYLLPTSSNSGVPNNVTESFNLSINVIWNPFARKHDPCPNRYRPLFGVADNGTLMINTK